MNMEVGRILNREVFDLINEGSHSRRAATVFACSGNILPRHPPSSLSYKEIR